MLAGAGLVSLAFVGVAAADNEQIKLTPGGQARARHAVLQRSDLGTGAGWSGGAKSPGLNSGLPCDWYKPKQSDLVVIGAAETRWNNAGIELDSEAQVLRTPAMVSLDWKRTVLAPQIVPCLREGFSKAVGATGKLLSFGRAGIPGITKGRRFRAIVLVKQTQVMIDVVTIASGSTELTLTVTAPLTEEKPVSAAELIFARRLIDRSKA
jgi:hypothetical protein